MRPTLGFCEVHSEARSDLFEWLACAFEAAVKEELRIETGDLPASAELLPVSGGKWTFPRLWRKQLAGGNTSGTGVYGTSIARDGQNCLIFGLNTRINEEGFRVYGRYCKPIRG